MFMRPKTSDELQIRTYPAPVLRKKAAPVERVTPQLQALAEDMVELMRVADGVGLAAPQVGISLRIITIEANNKLHILFNPVIISRVGEETAKFRTGICDGSRLPIVGGSASSGSADRAWSSFVEASRNATSTSVP